MAYETCHPRGGWEPGRAYRKLDGVLYRSFLWAAKVDHVSGETFDRSKWSGPYHDRYSKKDELGDLSSLVS